MPRSIRVNTTKKISVIFIGKFPSSRLTPSSPPTIDGMTARQVITAITFMTLFRSYVTVLVCNSIREDKFSLIFLVFSYKYPD